MVVAYMQKVGLATLATQGPASTAFIADVMMNMKRMAVKKYGFIVGVVIFRSCMISFCCCAT